MFNAARQSIDVWNTATGRWTAVGDVLVVARVADLPSWMLEGDVAYVQATSQLHVLTDDGTGNLVWAPVGLPAAVAGQVAMFDGTSWVAAKFAVGDKPAVVVTQIAYDDLVQKHKTDPQTVYLIGG